MMLYPKGHHFSEQILQGAESWQESMKTKDWDRTEELLQNALERCKDILSSGDNGEEKNIVLLRGILIRGIQDTTQLFRRTSTEGWCRDTTKIEDTWESLCNAQDRLSYVSMFTNLNKLAGLIGFLYAIDAEFLRVFGPGKYVSPEILVRKQLCSVCGQDFKGCEHIPGYLYDGVRCVGFLEDPTLKAVSIVDDPKDRRCRIWPWRFTSENSSWIRILTAFSIDDFCGQS